jgi:hypothetical protein
VVEIVIDDFDGRFLMLRLMSGRRIDLHVTLNWIDEVRARLADAQ